MLQDGLYHKELTDWVSHLALGKINLRYTTHAKDRTAAKRLPVLKSVIVREGDVFECEVKDGQVVKLAVRIRWTKRADLCLVLRQAGNGGGQLVITCWSNSVNDQHQTLDITKYNTAA